MKKSEAKTLKKGDVVAPSRGYLSNFAAKVVDVWDLENEGDSDILIQFEFIDPNVEKIRNRHIEDDYMSYRYVKLLS